MTSSYIYSFSGLSNPNYAIQINSGHYIISDYGNQRIIELDPTLSTVVRSYYGMDGVVFFDYSEANDTLLVTSETINVVVEITWSDMDSGTTIWKSNCPLNSPQCATYKQGDITKIVIADTDNNRIIKYDRTLNTYEPMYNYNVNSGSPHEISSFYRPYRVYQYSDGNICVVEKQGRPINFDMFESSSSSSSLSSESSSSESSSSSSFCCISPTCISGACSVLSNWNLTGMRSYNTDNCKLYVNYHPVGSFDVVSVYKDVGHTQLVAIGLKSWTLLPGTITLTQQNSSGLSGTVYGKVEVTGNYNLVIQC